MVLHKRLDYGFNGFRVPYVPRSTRSVRKRRLFKRKAEDSQMCAFELLATVAGELLQERATSPKPSNPVAGRVHPSIVKDTVKQEQQDEGKPLKAESVDPGSYDECVFVPDLSSEGQKQNYSLKDFQRTEDNVGLELKSILTNSDCSERGSRAEIAIADNRNEFVKIPSKMDGESPRFGESCVGNAVNGNERQLESERQKISNVINGTVPDACSSEYPMELDIKPPALVSSDSSVEIPICGDHIPHSSFLPFREDVKLVSKDDDENSSGCTRPSTGSMKAFRPSPRIGDRRIRKLLASKYWKVAPKLNDGELSNNGMKPVFRNRKACYTRQRSQRNSLFKRRRLFERCSVSTSGGTSSDGFSNPPKKGIDGDSSGSACRASSSVANQSSFQSRDSHVKLSIRSFRVPELFIEIPETATVGSLKRTVMEAVNAILGGGLRVGVVLQGKKVRDDNKTLLQTGISDDDKQDALGFTLEPSPAPAPVSVSVSQSLDHEDPQCLVPCNTPQPLARYVTAPVLDPASSDASPYPTTLTNVGNFVESDRDSVPSRTNISADKTPSDSRALVAIPTSVEALAVVPLHRKSRRSELAQRRIRRPFSVTEVEALVQAVEKLGTGRWRDVKLRAFDNAKHRTYVDLKDKWKTLVHTARISPQQRRGEPVPQELLDRVLAAHAYWSQQQAKQQVKQQTETCLLI